MEVIYKDVTDKLIRAFYNVYNKLGYGFAEKVYENSMVIELRALGLKCEKQKPIKVYYEGLPVGEYYADLVINDCVIVELKSGAGIVPEHEAQLLNYLRATDIEVGFLMNFGEKAIFRRKYFTNDRKVVINTNGESQPVNP
jgi:GxxExxY protein